MNNCWNLMLRVLWSAKAHQLQTDISAWNLHFIASASPCISDKRSLKYSDLWRSADALLYKGYLLNRTCLSNWPTSISNSFENFLCWELSKTAECCKWQHSPEAAGVVGRLLSNSSRGIHAEKWKSFLVLIPPLEGVVVVQASLDWSVLSWLHGLQL